MGMTLSRHLLAEERRHPESAGPLSMLLSQLAFAAKLLSRELTRAALVGKLGLTGEKNPTGDAQKKLDVFSNEVVIEAFVNTNLVASIASEELEEVKCIACSADAEHVLCIDPLDGSSNTDINAAVGTIFGIYRRKDGVRRDPEEDFLRKGSEQVAAGYVLYGTGTIFVYTIGHGVHGFTLDPDLGEFLLSHEDLRCPPRGRIFSANVTRSSEWLPGVGRFIGHLTEDDPGTSRPYSLRYTGALVSDLHRCLIEGGLYFYPADRGNPEGKLRLLYECAPLAYLIEQAGGRAGTGAARILDLPVESIHQRAPLVIGSAEDVMLYERFVAEGPIKEPSMSFPGREIEILDTPEAMSRRAAEEFVRLAEEGVRAKGRFTVALSGGSTPRRLYSLLAGVEGPHRARVPWRKTHFFWGDERHVPADHPDSNYRMGNEALLSKAPVPAENVHRIHAENPDAQGAARDYEKLLREFFGLKAEEPPRFDLVLLGMGADGHTASIFPGTGLTAEENRLVAASWVEKFNAYRITLTPPVLNSAACVIFIVGGAEKAEALHAVLSGEPNPDRLPAQVVLPTNGRLLWLVDRAAARRLEEDG